MDISASQSLNTIWARLIIEELIRQGITYFCLSPGSRSTPLTAAVADHSKAGAIIHFDERGAAFHALGYARATGRPAVLICTSGTAVANYYPAVIEAAQDHIPLIVLSADRPSELLETEANQTIAQHGIFGDYIRWSMTLPAPEENYPPAALLTSVDQAIYRARRAPAGPVHLNCMFRKPLEPDTEGYDHAQYLYPLAAWLKTTQPYTQYKESTTALREDELDDISQLLNKTRLGLIVVGQLQQWLDRLAVLQLARSLHWPIFPDILSGLRLGTENEPDVIHYFDQLLLINPFIEADKPQTILHIGGRFTSKRLLQLIDQHPPDNYIHVRNHPLRYDPTHHVTQVIEAEPIHFVETIVPTLNRYKVFGWTSHLRRLSDTVDQVISKFVQQSELNEITAARALSRLVPETGGLFLASSMPIREMDMVGAMDGQIVYTAGNRGASGIDGTLATAIGFAAGLDKPVTVLCGDLAFLHDLNSLAMLRSAKHPLIIVLINNNGGGIFHFLPIRNHADIFEPYFGTPHGLTFERAAELFALSYHQPQTMSEFTDAYQTALATTQSSLIEIRTDRDVNHRQHQELHKRIAEALHAVRFVQ